MELTAFKNTPDELIRLIMEYARPTYPYLAELKLFQGFREDIRANGGTQVLGLQLFTHLKILFKNYRIVGKYDVEWGDDNYNQVMSDISYLGAEMMEMEENTNHYDTISEYMLDYINYHNVLGTPGSLSNWG